MIASENVQQPPAVIGDDIILCTEQVTKIYPGTVALDKVDFQVYRGKVNVLVGENGAGKSTLMKILAGVELVTGGRLLLEGREIQPRSPREAEALGISIIYQELNLFPNMNVAENIFMAHEQTHMGLAVKHGIQEQRARDLLARLDQPINPRLLVQNLRIGQQQIVEIAKALAFDMRILIMDEPTSALSDAEVERLFRVIEDLKAAGVTIIYISHKLEELMQIGDFITVLRDGHKVAESPMSEVTLPWIIERMVGHDTTASYQPPQHSFGDEILRVQNMTLPKSGGGYLVENVNLSLRAGEILGIYGLMGAGRTELFECLMGLHSQSSGTVQLGNQALYGLIDRRIHQGMMLIPEDRQREGLVSELSVTDNMLLASLKRFFNGLFLSSARETDSIRRMIHELSIKVSNPKNLVSSLSGGNQQKVVVAKSLLTEPKVLLMDEPTRGVDVGAKEEIFEITRRLAAQGLGIIFVSTELKEIMAIADRIIVMSKGCITKEFSRAEATQQSLVEASAIGHERNRKDNG